VFSNFYLVHTGSALLEKSQLYGKAITGLTLWYWIF